MYTPGFSTSRRSTVCRAVALVGIVNVLALLFRLIPSLPAQSASSPLQTNNNPLDEPLRLIAEASQAYQGVKDYTCLLVSQERIKGKLEAENVITMKVRKEPFGVYLRWQAPRQLAEQEVCYVAGQNNGMMRVHSPGLLGIFGFISIDPRDPRVFEHSRHDITEAGIGHLIEQFGSYWQVERPLSRLHVVISEYEFDRRRCTRVEGTYPNSKPGDFYAYRTAIYFDQQSHLPIRVENYGWPTADGSSVGELLESYSHVDLRLNVNLDDNTFKH
jgi:hypothetical protein